MFIRHQRLENFPAKFHLFPERASLFHNNLFPERGEISLQKDGGAHRTFLLRVKIC